MKLKELIKDISVISASGNLDAEVKGLCQDSNLFKPGDLFIAIKGNSFNGNSFIPEALAKGASGVLTEREPGTFKVPGSYSGNIMQVESTRECVAPLAKKFFGNPSEKLFLVGVTGTNGKTTTSYMIEALIGSGVIGTIGAHYKNESLAVSLTTPDSIFLQSTLAHWVKGGAKSVAMEVTSHALSQGRADGLSFDVGVFTNLTRDHLDFHGTFENYIQAKAKLFKDLLKNSPKKNKRAILNCEDPSFEKLKPTGVPIWTYGFQTGDFKIKKMSLSFDETDLEIETPSGLFRGQLQMVGKHNVENCLAALAVATHHGLSLQDAAARFSKLSGVPGRLERVSSKSEVRVFVDFAHTDDGLVNTLSFLKRMRDETSGKSKIITVFGCGGDRDRGKRPMMMKAAMKYSDFVVVTSDNPRTEDPEKIIQDVIKDTPKSEASKFAMDADRRQAIQSAIERAAPGDVVLIAGRGHEKFQLAGGKKIPFDDVTVAKEILNS